MKIQWHLLLKLGQVDETSVGLLDGKVFRADDDPEVVDDRGDQHLQCENADSRTSSISACRQNQASNCPSNVENQSNHVQDQPGKNEAVSSFPDSVKQTRVDSEIQGSNGKVDSPNYVISSHFVAPFPSESVDEVTIVVVIVFLSLLHKWGQAEEKQCGSGVESKDNQAKACQNDDSGTG